MERPVRHVPPSELAAGRAALQALTERRDRDWRAAVAALTPEQRALWDDDTHAPPGYDGGPFSDGFARWLTRVQEAGWTRKQVHDVLLDVHNDPRNDFVLATLDDLFNIDTAITGDCVPDGIIRFPGDPDDVAELTAHVRGRLWR